MHRVVSMVNLVQKETMGIKEKLDRRDLKDFKAHKEKLDLKDL
jgi:hypothetical protein